MRINAMGNKGRKRAKNNKNNLEVSFLAPTFGYTN